MRLSPPARSLTLCLHVTRIRVLLRARASSYPLPFLMREVDAIEQALEVGRQVDAPVKVFYTREEGNPHDVFHNAQPA